MDIFASPYSKQLLEKILTTGNEGVVLSDAQNTILYVNPAFVVMTGFSSADIVGKTGSFLRSERHDAFFYKKLWQSVQDTGVWQGEMWVRRKNDEIFLEWLSLSVIKDKHGAVLYYLTIFSDITERKTNAERIQYLAYYDPLTNLANRSKAHDYLTTYLHKAQQKNQKIALFYIDLDRFKNVNAMFGLFVGDQLLQKVAKRLESQIREGEMVARMVGDEFLIIVPAVKTVDEIVHIGQRIIDIMQSDFKFENESLHITASIGISMFPTDGDEVDPLIKNAEIAMFIAQKNGGNNYQFFTQDMNIVAVEYLTLETQLRQAVERGLLELYYQPLVSLANNKICGVEALLRWHQPKVGDVSPSKFIPVAEESGLIIPITEWVLQKACSDNRAWQAAGLAEIPVAVNISAHYLRRKNFQETIARIVRESGIDVRKLKLELTEGAIMEDVEGTIKKLMALKEMGLHFAIDDFGTGYSSLSYLKRLPVEQLKIDQSFVRDLEVNLDDRAIIRAIISLAKNLKLTVIAEGVETQAQLEFLREHHCDIIQGYYFSRPVRAEDIMKMQTEGKQLQ